MNLSLIVAMGDDGVIGAEGRLPWHLPRDLRTFREITWGKLIVMGRKTFESIGRPLPGRRNVILSHREAYRPAGCVVVHSLGEVFDLARAEPETMVIGGAEVFRQTLPYCDRLYLTRVAGHFEGDVFFPVEEILESEWDTRETREFEADAKNPHRYRFSILERNRPDPRNRLA